MYVDDNVVLRIDNEEEIISDDQETNNSQTDTTEIFEKEEALSQIDQTDIESPAKTDKSPLSKNQIL